MIAELQQEATAATEEAAMAAAEVVRVERAAGRAAVVAREAAAATPLAGGQPRHIGGEGSSSSSGMRLGEPGPSAATAPHPSINQDVVTSGLPPRLPPDGLPKVDSHAIRPDNDIFRVESLLATRAKGGRRMYLVRWAEYGAEEDSWEAASNIFDPNLIRAFEQGGGGGSLRQGGGGVASERPSSQQNSRTVSKRHADGTAKSRGGSTAGVVAPSERRRYLKPRLHSAESSVRVGRDYQVAQIPSLGAAHASLGQGRGQGLEQAGPPVISEVEPIIISSSSQHHPIIIPSGMSEAEPPYCRCGVPAALRYGRWMCARRLREDHTPVEAAKKARKAKAVEVSLAAPPAASCCAFETGVPPTRPPLCGCGAPAAWFRNRFWCERDVCGFEVQAPCQAAASAADASTVDAASIRPGEVTMAAVTMENAAATAALLTAVAYGPLNAWSFVHPCDCGLGLFARVALVPGQFIAEYSGPRLPSRLQTGGSYVLSIPGTNIVIDGAHSPDCPDLP